MFIPAQKALRWALRRKMHLLYSESSAKSKDISVRQDFHPADVERVVPILRVFSSLGFFLGRKLGTRNKG